MQRVLVLEQQRDETRVQTRGIGRGRLHELVRRAPLRSRSVFFVVSGSSRDSAATARSSARSVCGLSSSWITVNIVALYRWRRLVLSDPHSITT